MENLKEDKKITINLEATCQITNHYIRNSKDSFP